MKGYFILFVVVYVFNGLAQVKGENGDYVRKPGYCMWYGQCGINPSTHQAINCLYNKQAKPVADPKSHDILAQLCPEFAKPDSKVCCDYKQLVSLQSGIQSAQQMMARCPACWKNFRELYCRLTCSPNNSLFIDPTQLSADKKSIISIDYHVDKKFRDGLYNSCKDVIFPTSNQKIMNFLCGTTADKCTPLKFLDFMGDPELNGVSPFLIQYPETTKSGLKPMSTKTKLCNETVFEPFSNSTFPPCSCEDCIPSCHLPFPIKLAYLAAKIIFSLKPSSKLNKRTCYTNFYVKDCQLTGTILRLDVLQKILKVQRYLMNMAVPNSISGSEKITFGDFCVKPSGSYSDNCTVMSVLQYWQNDVKKLNKCISALGEPCPTPQYVFRKAAWGDHLHRCLNNPEAKSDGTVLQLPCTSAYSMPVPPWQVLGGYEGKNYTDASVLFVTFAIKNHLSKAEVKNVVAWEEKFVDYLKHYEDDDLQLAYVPFDLPRLPVRRLGTGIKRLTGQKYKNKVLHSC